jgi:hypothetical protein
MPREIDISNHDDIIDSRDVIERIEHLEAVLDDLKSEAHPTDARREAIADAEAELSALRGLAKQGEQCAPDWSYGVALTRDSYFEDYAKELAEDLGLIKADAGWPNNCIDWGRAARELRVGYTPVEFNGVTYWVR